MKTNARSSAALPKSADIYEGTCPLVYALAIIGVGILANYLPWVAVTRCTFIYHFFACVPFIILATAYLLQLCEEKAPSWRSVKWVWMAVAVIFFLLLYPGLSGLPVSNEWAAILHKLFREAFKTKPAAAPLAAGDEAMNHVLLAGASPVESAWDSQFNGQAWGALSYHALSILNEKPNLSWEELHRRIRQRLPSSDAPQSPQLEGPASALLRRVRG